MLNPDVYDEIACLKPAKGGEIQFTDALNALCGKAEVCAYDFEGRRYDMGDKFGAIQATLEYGFKLAAYLKELAKA